MNYLTKEGSQKSIMQLPGDVMTKYWHILTINWKCHWNLVYLIGQSVHPCSRNSIHCNWVTSL